MCILVEVIDLIERPRDQHGRLDMSKQSREENVTGDQAKMSLRRQQGEDRREGWREQETKHKMEEVF